MGGGVSPFEWIVPPVALAHSSINMAADLAGAKNVKLTTPGSSDDQANREQDQGDAGQEAARNATQQQATAAAQVAQDRSPEEEERARIRAKSASELLGGAGRRRASQTLTDSTALLSGAAR